MSKIIAYIRASTDKQDLNHQKLEILEFARKQNLKIDDFIEMTISSRETSRKTSKLVAFSLYVGIRRTSASYFVALKIR
jgi:DNA invertase Pin-like site-specific DNA recombinase